MKIILIRHGKPDIDTHQKLTSDEMAQWIAAYDRSEVSENPPAALAQFLSTKRSLAIASSLPRAIASIKKLGIEPTVIDSDFREAQLPLINLPWLKISPLIYAFWLRILRLAGFAVKVDSRSLSQQRAARAAGKLIQLADNNQNVVLMEHGVFHRMLGAMFETVGLSVTA